MHSGSYDPKDLLSTLMEVERRLETTIEKHCPDKQLSLSEDLDKALEDFLQLKEVKDNEIGYLSSQLALLHLRKEVEKAINVVVESNNLRAYHDFGLHKGAFRVSEPTQKGWVPGKTALLTVLAGLLIAAVSLFFMVR
ncbi:hypothetical protein BC792_13324 [Sphingobacterium allocomposti]|uniref:Uncharacterized protein n=1 Tax=Sphingobacterium allocomposti TaxID=415956 RepID=A0A5S5CZM0_9SPHI|nr:hypothetical protein [Sphingobacterium composti Yoo et al. 2007 non Ten et al. 2007]TYP87829.1 hypothetical protein BC792_13324 [Sphingobacterium composti Yoo et al. 2007 non Ten et al. 2007]